MMGSGWAPLFLLERWKRGQRGAAPPCSQHLKAKQAAGTGSSKDQPRRVSMLSRTLFTRDRV